MRMFSTGVVGMAGLPATGIAQEWPKATNGLAPVKIRDIRTIIVGERPGGVMER